MDSLEMGPTQPQAFGLLAFYCLIYVLPLHAYPPARASPHRSRDDPRAIQARIRVVSLSTAACSMATFLIIAYYQSAADSWRLMGFWPLGILATLRTLLLTALLFAAPLYECLVINGAWEDWVHLQAVRDVWADWPAWRNLVAGPITEECLFRSAAVSLLILAGSTLKTTLFLSPLVFGLAHVHHFYEFRVTHPRVSLAAAIARSVLQFSYTYLFGIYATFVFLRTGSLLAAIVVHSFCNSMGLPRVWGPVNPYWHAGSPSSQSSMLWTVLYYILLFLGAMSWYWGLSSLSKSPSALVNF